MQPGIQIYLSTPAKAEDFKMVGEELIAVIKDREKAKKAEEMRIRAEAEAEKAKAHSQRWNEWKTRNEYDTGDDETISEYERRSGAV